MKRIQNLLPYLLLFFSLVLAGCALTLDQKEHASQSKLFAKIERSACLGACPVFSLAIYFDGTAIFHGAENTKTIGADNINLSKSQLVQISDAFTRTGFLMMNSSCCGCDQMADKSLSLITYQGNGPYKQIKNYRGCSSLWSKELTELEDLILDITDARALIGK